MIRHLTIEDVLDLHARVIEYSGGSPGLRDWDLLESALAQPKAGFGGVELYPGLSEKAAAALGYSLICNHPFRDGNKRIGHAAMELFLSRNGYRIEAVVEEQELVVLAVAAGEMNRGDFTIWLQSRTVSLHV